MNTRQFLPACCSGTLRGIVLLLTIGSATGRAADDKAKSDLSWNQDAGITFQTPAGELLLDRAPTLKFLDKNGPIERRLAAPKVERPGAGQLLLRYDATDPSGRPLQIIRRITTAGRTDEADYVEEITLIPSARINVDLEIEWPFRIRGGKKGISPISRDQPSVGARPEGAAQKLDLSPFSAVFPTFNGRAKTFPLSTEPLRGQWQMCNIITDVKSQQLGLPVVQIGQKGDWLGAICADPEFGSLFELTADDETVQESRVGQAKRSPTNAKTVPGGAALRLSHPTSENGDIRGAVRFRYASSIVPLEAGKKESRRFGVWLAKAKKGISPISPKGPEGAAQKLDLSPFSEPFGRSIDAYFRLMLPDVPPGPKWLHEIAMVDYDFLSDGGEGWERDVRELARLLKPAERRRVALCFHGWYDTLGGYSFDDKKQEIKPEWVAMARTRKVPMSIEIMRRKLKLARDLGFHALVYFADGLNQDDGVPSYRADWDLVTLDGKRLTGWTGPDTWGKTYVRNPANPEVFQWHQDYLAALIRAFGPVTDGFVWDETFHVRAGTMTRSPQPAYCDRAMFRLVKKLTAQVEAYDPQKVFLVSDSPNDQRTIPGYATVADGTYQDSGCWLGAWPYGLFPNWRNTLWSCNWGSLSRFEKTKLSVERYGVPVAISNGWTDDRGPSEWTPAERDKILALFRKQLARKDRLRFIPDP